MAHTSTDVLEGRDYTCSNCGKTEHGICAPKGWYMGADGKPACSYPCALTSHRRWKLAYIDAALAHINAEHEANLAGVP